MKTVLVFAGIRSQYIKLASFKNGLRKDTALEWKFVNTGQHYDSTLSRQYIEEFLISFDFELTCGSKEKNPTEVFAQMIISCEEVIRATNPSAAVVFGDANTTLAAGLAVRRNRIPLIHVEAGLRTYSNTIEELNRILVDRMSQLHIASTRRDLESLNFEGYKESAVYVGDLIRDIAEGANFHPRGAKPFVLVSLHREENTKDLGCLESILKEIEEQGYEIVLIAHPRIAGLIIDKYKTLQPWPFVDVKHSLKHSEFLSLFISAEFAVTDSGAMQREGYYVGTRCVVIQEVAFWPTLIDFGFNILSPPNRPLRDSISEIVKPFDKKIDDFGSPPIAMQMCKTIEKWIENNT